MIMEPTKKKNLTVDAGVIASLGRDSIKDHTTAILELIKNSYDAGSTIVDVEIMFLYNCKVKNLKITNGFLYKIQHGIMNQA